MIQRNFELPFAPLQQLQGAFVDFFVVDDAPFVIHSSTSTRVCWEAHSFHCYFLRPGDAKRPIVYEVEATRDGTSLSSRRIRAVQGGRTLLFMGSSFHLDEEGLDSMWFHRPFRADDWLLYDVDSPSSAAARALVRGRLFSRAGSLVASTAQEGLIRLQTQAKRPVHG